MKKFIFKTSCFFALLAMLFTLIVYIVCFVIPPQFSHSYNASFNDKIERLLSIREPKIILVGNSNLTFGIKSQMIEQEFNKPVINLGLHGSLGNEFHENMAKINISSGDIIIISHTSYDDDIDLDNTLMLTTLECKPHLLTKTVPGNYYELLKSLPEYMSKKIFNFTHNRSSIIPKGCYSRTAFNKYGDISYPRAECEFIIEETYNPSKISDKTVTRINNLNDYCLQKGATLFVAAFPVGYGQTPPDESLYIDFQNKLKEKLNCKVISDFTDYFFDNKYLYDKQFHLTDEGAKIRTQQLINDIKNNY